MQEEAPATTEKSNTLLGPGLKSNFTLLGVVVFKKKILKYKH